MSASQNSEFHYFGEEPTGIFMTRPIVNTQISLLLVKQSGQSVHFFLDHSKYYYLCHMLS